MADSTMAISDLPRDTLEDVLSRVPLKSLRSLRLTSKKLNTLLKDERFTKKYVTDQAKAAAEKDEFLAIMVMDFRVHLTSVNIDDSGCTCINRQAELISPNNANPRVDISRVFHCEGLLLCVTKGIKSKLVVWDPYSGQTRWIDQPRRTSYHNYVLHALGYETEKKDKSFCCHKILRFLDVYDLNKRRRVREFEIYNFKTSSWKVLRVPNNFYVDSNRRGVTLKGNTYWCGHLNTFVPDWRHILICFDFTRERFGPHMHLPFQADRRDTLAVSSGREEQLAVLLHRREASRLEIWVTSKIEPEDVSWNKLFLEMDTASLTGFQFPYNTASFFIDQKRSVAVVFDEDNLAHKHTSRYIAHVIGKNGCVQKLDLGECTESFCWLFACSYVPSLVQKEQPVRRSKRKRNQLVH
ncbi:hypothetical protein EUTSA_v10007777mg [Eutrema salsugineum]|uniref:F-box domain-containing protein n=1 Tax=Eutrema salsugineum TaxID=72664 RepID=V4L0T3_EUTSA|nr:F-box/kelch-repeat protein At3g16740 [Eutrema salsugineum]ESQ35927.1 hypothetical protein EUTSA_v10007777mg [Eutrema salsugineum]